MNIQGIKTDEHVSTGESGELLVSVFEVNDTTDRPSGYFAVMLHSNLDLSVLSPEKAEELSAVLLRQAQDARAKTVERRGSSERPACLKYEAPPSATVG